MSDDIHTEYRYSVYKHTSPNGKVYIGLTGLKPEYRWNHGIGYRKNPYFWKAILKYGWDNFEHEILFTELSKQEAIEKEKELIQLYDSTNRDKGYNLSTGGESGQCGVHPSEETRRKMSESTKGDKNPMFGKHHTEEARKKISENRVYLKGEDHPSYGKPCAEYLIASKLKPVVQLDKKGNFIAEYVSEKIAAKQTGIDPSQISEACDNTNKSAGGFMWVSKNMYDSNYNYSYQNTVYKPVIQLDENNTFICEYCSVAEAERQTGINRKLIYRCCSGERKTTYGFQWIYKEKYLSDYTVDRKDEMLCS